MGLRDWINANPTPAAIVAGGVLVIGVAFVGVQLAGSGSASDSGRLAWYEDLKTGEVFTASADKVPPIQSPAGNRAIRAVMFSCGSCEDESKRFVGYYEKVPQAVRKSIEEVGKNNVTVRYLVCDGEKDPSKEQNWVSLQRRSRGGRLQNDPTRVQCDDGSRAKQCRPKQ